jgi:hypothetical protein
MKIVFCKDRATFVGWHIACDEGRMLPICAPEIPRAMGSAGVSTSSSTIQAAKDGDMATIRRLACASSLARAYEFSGIVPSISEKFLAFALEAERGEVADREMSMRAFGEEGHGSTEIVRVVQERNLGVSPDEEADTLKALRCESTADEMDAFRCRVWSLEPSQLLDYDGFTRSLPVTWR